METCDLEDAKGTMSPVETQMKVNTGCVKEAAQAASGESDAIPSVLANNAHPAVDANATLVELSPPSIETDVLDDEPRVTNTLDPVDNGSKLAHEKEPSDMDVDGTAPRGGSNVSEVEPHPKSSRMDIRGNLKHLTQIGSLESMVDAKDTLPCHTGTTVNPALPTIYTAGYHLENSHVFRRDEV